MKLTVIPSGQLKELEGVMIPDEIFAMPDLSHGAKLLYGYIETYGEGRSITARREELAKPLDVTLRQLDRYVRELKNKGLMNVSTPLGGKPNTYYITSKDEGGPQRDEEASILQDVPPKNAQSGAAEPVSPGI